MKKLSKVKSVQGNGTWSSNDGTLFYKFDYVFEDGQSLSAMHKDESNALPVGEMAEYEVKGSHPTYGDRGSVGKPQQGGGGSYNDNLLGIKIGHSLNCASVLLANSIADIPQGKEKDALKYWAHIVYEASNEMNAELSEGKDAV